MIALTGDGDCDGQPDQGNIVLEQRGVPSGVDDGHGALKDGVGRVPDGVCAEHDLEGGHCVLAVVHAVGGGHHVVGADQGASAEGGALRKGQEESNLGYATKISQRLGTVRNSPTLDIPIKKNSE